MKISILKTLGAFKAGQVVDVEADANGIPRSLFWRKRLKDAGLDGFCEIVKEKTEEPKPATDKKARTTQENEG